MRGDPDWPADHRQHLITLKTKNCGVDLHAGLTKPLYSLSWASSWQLHLSMPHSIRGKLLSVTLIRHLPLRATSS